MQKYFLWNYIHSRKLKFFLLVYWRYTLWFSVCWSNGCKSKEKRSVKRKIRNFLSQPVSAKMKQIKLLPREKEPWMNRTKTKDEEERKEKEMEKINLFNCWLVVNLKVYKDTETEKRSLLSVNIKWRCQKRKGKIMKRSQTHVRWNYAKHANNISAWIGNSAHWKNRE